MKWMQNWISTEGLREDLYRPKKKKESHDFIEKLLQELDQQFAPNYYFFIPDLTMVDQIVKMRSKLAGESDYVNEQDAIRVKTNLQNLKLPDVLEIVILHRHELVGFCCTYSKVNNSTPNTAHIAQIALLKKHQGQGLATAMIEASCEWAKSIGCRDIHLSVDGDNPNARKLYEKLKFREIEKHEYYELGRTL